MILTIKINMDNSAFEGDNKYWELTRIFNNIISKLPNNEFPIHDVNGNNVGFYKESEEK